MELIQSSPVWVNILTGPGTIFLKGNFRFNANLRPTRSVLGSITLW